MPFLPPNQQRQSTEGHSLLYLAHINGGYSAMLSRQTGFDKTAATYATLFMSKTNWLDLHVGH